MNKNLRFGLIGCGLLGRTHARCIQQIGDAQFTAFADVTAEAAESALIEFGGDYATTDMERLWRDSTLDAVYICTRHDSHAALAIAAARAGKHIFIEKPLALNLDDCATIAHVVAEQGVHLMPAFKLRYYPLLQRAHAFIPEPQVMVVQMMDERWADDIWPQDPIQGGGNVHSQGCHSTDIIRYLAGSEPVQLWAAGGALSHPGHSCIDQCVASIIFENGHVASWIQGDAGMGALTGKFFIQLFGRGATGQEGYSVQLYDRCRRAVFSDGTQTWTEERTEEEGLLLENQAFVHALLSNNAPALTVHDGVQATRMVLSAEKAIRTGEIQNLVTQPIL